MRARPRRPMSRVWDKLRLEWEVGLQRLPFFTQRLAVALVGLLVVSLALVGGMMVLWGGQGPELQLRPPPEAQPPAGPTVPGAPAPSGTQPGGGAQAPAGVQSSTSSPSEDHPGAAPGATTPTSTTRAAPTTTTGTGGLGPLPVPPVLSTLLK